MALYLTATGTFKLGTDSTLAELLAARSLSLTEGEDHEEFSGQFIELANGASGEAVSLGPLTTCKALLIYSSRQITVNINGSEAIPLGHTAAEACWILLPATSFTSLTLSNSSGDVALVHVVMAGA